jgi:hypothetical protein
MSTAGYILRHLHSAATIVNLHQCSILDVLYEIHVGVCCETCGEFLSLIRDFIGFATGYTVQVNFQELAELLHC